ncbi:MAG: prepilin-type N-terminal cleavage/methylation domain-containing protein [Sulfuritalea sp.]|nr:prepilin-type N-terminal cleavage/methylation domain-containing protein [Sulfuritalea sp.]
MIFHRIRASACRRPAGFSLIELLVALAIGLIGAVAIMQVYIGGETGKRVTGSLGEAQSGALIALYQIEREVQRAGLGFLSVSALGCNIRSNLGSALNNRFLQPVSIVPAGAGIGHFANHWGIPPGDPGADMLVVVAGDGGTLVEGSRLALAAPAGTTLLRLGTAQGIAAGDFLLVSESGQDCTLARATAPPALSGEVSIDHATVTAYTDQAMVMHLGAVPVFAVYAVRGGVLTRCDFGVSNCADAGLAANPAVWTPVANDVVALVAQYGFDTTAIPDGIVDVFCKDRVAAGGACPSPDTGLGAAPGADPSQPVRACDWTRMPIVQLAVVTRSGQAEREPVSPPALQLWPDTNVAPTTTGPLWNVPDQNFRYRVARGATALRNVIWRGAGC